MQRQLMSARISLIFLDVIWLFVSVLLALMVRHGEVPTDLTLHRHFLIFAPIIPATWFLAYICGLYSEHWRYPFQAVTRYLLTAIGLYGLYFYLFEPGGFTPKLTFALFLMWQVLGMILIRVVLDKMIPSRFRAVMVTQSNINQAISNPRSLFVAGGHTTLLIPDHSVETEQRDRLYESVISHMPAIQVMSYSNWLELRYGKIDLQSLDVIWFNELVRHEGKRLYTVVKRLVDIILSIPLGILTLILFPFVSLAIWMEDKGAPIIWQIRVGQYGKHIRVPKFRSMTVNDEGHWQKEGNKVSSHDTSKITRIGKFIRATRIDELPQILNVLKGEISLIGPRPDIVGLYNTLATEIPHYNLRTMVQPGVTGWAQVTQKVVPHSIEETKDRLAYDLYYIKHRSVWLDFVVVIKTVKTVFERRGN